MYTYTYLRRLPLSPPVTWPTSIAEIRRDDEPNSYSGERSTSIAEIRRELSQRIISSYPELYSYSQRVSRRFAETTNPRPKLRPLCI